MNGRHLVLPRTTLAATALALVVWLGGQLGSQTAQSLTVVSRDGRRSLAVSTLNDQEFAGLDEIAATFQLTVREEAGAITVSYKGRTIVLSVEQTIASVAGRMISLPARPVRAGGRLLVPVDFIGRAVAGIYDQRIDVRRTARLVIVGDLRVPRVNLTTESLPNGTRLTIDTAPATTSTLSQEGDHLTLRFDADALDVTMPSVQPQAFLQGLRRVDAVTLAVDLGPRYGSYRSSTETLDTRTRLTLELLPAPAPADTAASPTTAPVTPPPTPPVDLPAFGRPPSAIRTVSSTACLSKSTFFTPATFRSWARMGSAQLAQSAPVIEYTWVRSAAASAGRARTRAATRRGRSMNSV